MKKIVSFMLLALIAGSIQLLSAAPKSDKETVVFSVPLHCQACVDKVQKNIAFEKGVTGLDISLEKQQVTVVYHANKTNPETLQAAFEKIGKPATIISSTAADKEIPVTQATPLMN